MEAAMTSWLKQAGEAEARAPLAPEGSERLRALGYVQGPGGRGSGADPKDKVEVARRIGRAAGPFPDLAAAVAAYRELAALDPDNPLVNFRLADALLRSGHPREAVPYYQKVVAAGPHGADAHVGLATAYAALDRIEDARRVLEQALAIDPANGQVQYNLGEIARVRGQRQEARERYEHALADPVTRARAQARLQSLP
jgi:tetratricopeptide (TPR) repeat protein